MLIAPTDRYTVGTRVAAILGGIRFTGEIKSVGKFGYRVLPDEGQYFSKPENRRELLVPNSRSKFYSSSDTLLKTVA